MRMHDTDFKSSDPIDFFNRVGLGQKTVHLQPGQVFFSQGDSAHFVYCLQSGWANLQVVMANGKQTTLALFSRGEFFGEEPLAAPSGQRMATATALNACTAFQFNSDELVDVMRREPAFAAQFLALLVARGMRTQADLVDHKLNRSEMRLARTLLQMAEFAEPNPAGALIPQITQEALAEMIGTTRARCSFFMNRFRSMGLIQYKERIKVHKPQLEAALVSQFAKA